MHLLYRLCKCWFWRMNIWLMQSECLDEEAVSRRGAASRPGAGHVPTQRRAFYCTHSAALLSPLLHSAALCWYFPPRAHHLPCLVSLVIKFIFIVDLCVYCLLQNHLESQHNTGEQMKFLKGWCKVLISLQDQSWNWSLISVKIVCYLVCCWRKIRWGCVFLF